MFHKLPGLKVTLRIMVSGGGESLICGVYVKTSSELNIGGDV